MDKQKRLMLEEIANFTMYQRALSNQGINTKDYPIFKLNRETLLEAKEILKGLKDIIAELDAEIAKRDQGNYEFIQELRTKISD